jgi:hypothetical protein
MHIRFYSPPYIGGLRHVGLSLWVSYVHAEGGGGGDVTARLVEVFAPWPDDFGANAIRTPSPDEVFRVEGVSSDRLHSGNRIQLRTSDGHYVGICHDEEFREDSVVATAVQPGASETFMVEFLENRAIDGIDPCGPSYTIALLAPNSNYLSLPWSGDGPLDCCVDLIGSQQKFVFDYLPDPTQGRLPRYPKVK